MTTAADIDTNPPEKPPLTDSDWADVRQYLAQNFEIIQALLEDLETRVADLESTA